MWITSHASRRTRYASPTYAISNLLTPPKIHNPKNYHFGITAASSDHPDSFEIRSFIVRKLGDTTPAIEHHESGWHDQTGTTYDAATHHDPHYDAHHDEHHDAHHDAHHDGSDHDGWYWTEEKEHIPDKPADSFKTEHDRFGDLHDRVALLGHQLDIVFHDLTVFKEQTEKQHQELVHWMSPTHNYAQLAMHTVERVETLVQEIKKDVEGKDYREHLEQLHHAILEGHQALPYALGSGRSSHSSKPSSTRYI
jgi:lectin, mannose-binding 1